MSALKNLIHSDNISHITNMLSQIETAHNMTLAHKLMEIENNPAISAIQEALGRYEDILKPWVICAGIPCKVIKNREKQIKALAEQFESESDIEWKI